MGVAPPDILNDFSEMFIHVDVFSAHFQLSVMRKESHVIPESGAHICEGIGTCECVLFVIAFLLKAYFPL